MEMGDSETLGVACVQITPRSLTLDGVFQDLSTHPGSHCGAGFHGRTAVDLNLDGNRKTRLKYLLKNWWSWLTSQGLKSSLIMKSAP